MRRSSVAHRPRSLLQGSRTLDARRDDSGIEHGLHRRHGRECRACPRCSGTLNASVVDVQWVIEAYSLLLSAFLLAGGSLGDQFGRRRIFLLGIALFAVASAGCGLASTIRQLIAARAALQGFGAALLVPGSLAIISSSFPVEDRGRAIGTWSGFSAITAAVGPVLGGWLIEHVSWRAVFFINIPLALLVILISLWRVPESASEEGNATGLVGRDSRRARPGGFGLWIDRIIAPRLRLIRWIEIALGAAAVVSSCFS